ncbi:MAG TPA: DUF2520 domain-containing protein, partial [Thermoleophilaceae bacterium]|nr:DUF2520 domain-containing protein [Thermoleophilaceae bacterium]
REAGVAVEGPAGRGEVPRDCDAIVLCVPDAEIPAAAATVAGAAPLTGHTSGATRLDALEPAGGAAFGLHPLQTFPPGSGPETFRGAGLAPHEARALLAPLVRRTVESVAELDPASALTGPVARGDHGTVEAQRRAIEDVAPELLDLFDELVRHTRALAGHEVTA